MAKITPQNFENFYNNEFKVIQEKLNPTLVSGAKDVVEALPFYNDDEDIKNTIDNYLQKLNTQRDTLFPSNNVSFVSLPKEEKKSIQKPKKEKPKENPVEYVNKMPTTLRMLKRLVSLVNNKKDKEEYTKLLKKIKKEILEKGIKKADIGTPLILQLQKLLNTWIVEKSKKPQEELNILVEKCTSILNEYKVNPAVTLQKYAVTNLDNEDNEFQTKFKKKKQKLAQTMKDKEILALDVKNNLNPLEGTNIYKSKMPIWVQTIKSFIKKFEDTKKYNRELFTNELRVIQQRIVKLEIRKVDKGSKLINQIQYFLIEAIKAKKMSRTKLTKLMTTGKKLIARYKINPSTKVLKEAIKNPAQAKKQAKKLKGNYNYGKYIKPLAEGKGIPPLDTKPQKKK